MVTRGVRKTDICAKCRCRVLTVTTSRSRVDQMIEAQKEMTDGRGTNMFLFIDDARLLASNPLEVVWTTGKGKPVRITD